MITSEELDEALAGWLSEKPTEDRPCARFARRVLARVGMDIPDLETLDEAQRQERFLLLARPRAWCLVSLRDPNGGEPHVGVVLPDTGQFIHAPSRSLRVRVDRLDARFWSRRITGFWWPRDIVTCIVYAEPLGRTRRTWCFLEAPTVLSAVLAHAPDDGWSVSVDGAETPRERWDQTTLLGGETVTLRPQFGIAVPWPVWLVNLANMGWAMAASLALSTLAAPKAQDPGEPDEPRRAWKTVTSQVAGKPVPWLFGRVKVQGNIIGGWLDAEYAATWRIDPPGMWRLNVSYQDGRWYTLDEYLALPHVILGSWPTPRVTECRQIAYVDIGLGAGPIQGVVSGTEKINGEDIDSYVAGAATRQYSLIAAEHFNGTTTQTTSTHADIVEIPVEKLSYYDEEAETYVSVTATTPDSDFDDLAWVVHFRQGLVFWDDAANKDGRHVGVKLEMREVGGEWHTLAETLIGGQTTDPVRLRFLASGSYTGGASFPGGVTRGTAYEGRLTRYYEPGTSSRAQDAVYLEAIQQIYSDGFAYPGLAHTALTARASANLGDAIEYEAVVEGRIVEVYDPELEEFTLAFSRNPMSAIRCIVSQPIIAGDGDGEPYAVACYEGLDPALHLRTEDHAEVAAWCDEEVDDGAGGVEARFTFDAQLDAQADAFETILKIAAMCRVDVFWDGSVLRFRVRRARLPVAIFSASNILNEGSFAEEWRDDADRADAVGMTFECEGRDYAETPVLAVAAKQDNYHEKTLSGFGVTRLGQAMRMCEQAVAEERCRDRRVTLSAGLDAVGVEPGDPIIVQSTTLDRAVGAVVTAVGEDNVTLSVEVTASGGADGLMVRTVDDDGQHLTLYAVDHIDGDDARIVYIDGVWNVEPVVDDLVLFGAASQLQDIYRVEDIEFDGDGHARIEGAQYDALAFGPDEEAPRIDVQVFASPSPTSSRKGLAEQEWWRINSLLPSVRVTANVDASRPELTGMTFTGDGEDTVTWEGTDSDGEGSVTYWGYRWSIAGDAEGTTDRFIYWDPQDPNALHTTSDLADLRGLERFICCINIRGTAYPKSMLSVGADGSYVSIDDVLVGGMYEKAYQETFENAMNQPAGYLVFLSNPSVEASIEAEGGATGGKFLRIGNNSGTDNTLVIAYQSVPFNITGRLYRVRARVRRTAGSTTFSLGVAGRDETDTRWVNALGNDSTSYQYYCGPNEQAGTELWADYVGYFSGTAEEGDQDTHSHPRHPAALHADVRYVRALLRLNEYGAGTYDIDELVIEPIVPSHSEILPGAKSKPTDHSVTLATDGYAERFTNLGATGTVTAELPPWTEGSTYEFVRIADYAYRIKPKDGSGNTLRSGAAYYELLAVGDSVTLGALQSGIWDVLAYAQPGATGLAWE
jgi:hypothetical protein